MLKISGESLGPNENLDLERFTGFAEQIETIHRSGVAIAVVVGGGNIFRGPQGPEWGLDGAEADEVGMVATAVNAMLLRGLCQSRGVPVDIFSRGPCVGVGRPWEHHAVRESLEGRRVVLLAGGLGIPGMSTDVPAVHVAVETYADAVIMAKYGVDGVYDADPRIVPTAQLFPTIAASQALHERLEVIDLAALTLALEHNVLVHIVPASDDEGFTRVVFGEALGSIILPK